MKTITFNKNSTAWRDNAETNNVFLHYQIEYIYEMFKHRGYLYLNQIYELLGVYWDVENENICYRASDMPRIEYGPLDNNTFVVKVY